MAEKPIFFPKRRKDRVDFFRSALKVSGKTFRTLPFPLHLGHLAMEYNFILRSMPYSLTKAREKIVKKRSCNFLVTRGSVFSA